MTDKVQKIKDWISKTQDCLMDAQGNFENPSDEGAFHILTNLDYYIDSLQEEPVSEELEEAATQYGIDNFPSLCNGCKHVPVDAFKAGTKWQKAKDQKWIDDNHQQIFNEGYKNGSYAGRYDMYNRLLEAATTDRVVTHFLLAHSV